MNPNELVYEIKANEGRATRHFFRWDTPNGRIYFEQWGNRLLLSQPVEDEGFAMSVNPDDSLERLLSFFEDYVTKDSASIKPMTIRDELPHGLNLTSVTFRLLSQEEKRKILPSIRAEALTYDAEPYRD